MKELPTIELPIIDELPTIDELPIEDGPPGEDELFNEEQEEF